MISEFPNANRTTFKYAHPLTVLTVGFCYNFPSYVLLRCQASREVYLVSKNFSDHLISLLPGAGLHKVDELIGNQAVQLKIYLYFR